MIPDRRVLLQAQIQCACQAPDAIYRIYVDNVLITERTWIYGTNVAINEHIQANLYIGQHKLILEATNCSQTNFSIHNFKINNLLLHPVVRGLQVTFVVDGSSPPVA